MTMRALAMVAVAFGLCGSTLAQEPVSDPGGAFLPVPRLPGAQVTLPWSEMKLLLDRLSQIADQNKEMARKTSPPRDFLLSSASYSATVGEESTLLKARMEVDLLTDAWHMIRLVGGAPSVVSASVDGRPARLVADDGWLVLLLHGTGPKNIALDLRLPQGRARSNRLEFRVAPFPRNLLDLSIPRTGLAVNVEPAGETQLTEKEGETEVHAVIPQTDGFTVEWTGALAREEREERERPIVRASVALLVSVGGGLMKLDFLVTYAILQGKLDRFELSLPADTSILDVSGPGIHHHRVVKVAERSVVAVSLERPISGEITLQVKAEKALISVLRAAPAPGDTSTLADLPKVEVIGVERETGHIGITATTSVEVQAAQLDGLTPVDIKELPPALSEASPHPILLSYKYLKHPYRLVLDIKRHEDVAVLASTIDSAWVNTFQSRDGKLLHTALWRVKNTHKQFLQITLPETAKVLGAFVSGEAVKPALDQERHVLIPLEKSVAGEEEEKTFPVEFLYLEEGPAPGLLGTARSQTLKVDIPISVFNWTLSLPEPYGYLGFRGDFHPKTDREQRARKSGTGNRDAGERSQGTQEAGVMSTRINIPSTGQRFAFERELVMVDDGPPTLSYWYVSAGIIWCLRMFLTLGSAAAAVLAALALAAVRKGNDSLLRLRFLRRSLLGLVVLVAFDTYLFGPSVMSIASVLIAAVICVDAHLSLHRGKALATDAP